ncbi:MAG TPA: Uma2 family endonuclease, partial [Thermoanaerobaculia bacterium]|nr:Uma2 family endonuclease [Thermoanaerobaculia bacterium]
LVMFPASELHENLFRFLLTLLSFFLDERGGGSVRGSRYPMRLDGRWSPEPDLLVVMGERQQRMTRQRLEGPADLVIEVASDGDPAFDLREKLPRYEQAGIPEIWLLFPAEKLLRVRRKTADGYVTLEQSSGRFESVVIPGFWIEVSWLWQQPLPATSACLRQILG